MKEVITKCDLCESSIKVISMNIIVRFETEQTEGRPVEPYLQRADIDLCNECLDYYIKKLPISGCGAQGHNKYRRG